MKNTGAGFARGVHQFINTVRSISDTTTGPELPFDTHISIYVHNLHPLQVVGSLERLGGRVVPT